MFEFPCIYLIFSDFSVCVFSAFRVKVSVERIRNLDKTPYLIYYNFLSSTFQKHKITSHEN